MFTRFFLLVLDSVGVGTAPDVNGALNYNTLKNTLKETKQLLPNLEKLGLLNVLALTENTPFQRSLASFGVAVPQAPAHDTITGHWEMMGHVLQRPLPTYPHGFPKEIIERFCAYTGTGVLGNIAASGTDILMQLGQLHMATGQPIVYTSADSVFQIAAHEDVLPLEQLYDLCRFAREILVGEHGVGRVIARPFRGRYPDFWRTGNRQDFSLPPTGKTVLDMLEESLVPVHAVGKVADIFAHRGITHSYLTKSNQEGIEQCLKLLKDVSSGMIFANLVEFDSLYGHRRDVFGYGEALAQFDQQLPKVIKALGPRDCLLVTADHGCDPTAAGTDHTRELLPILFYASQVKSVNLGYRKLADIGATIAHNFNVESPKGQSFLPNLYVNGVF